jgi:hypothetical protein
MNKLWSKQACLGACWLMFFLVDQPRAEFRLLEPHSETRVGRIEKFVAAEAFKVGSRIGGRTLSTVGFNFAQHFLAVVEENVPEVQMNAWTLLYATGDTSLIKVSGGEESVARFIAHIHHLMELGDEGPSHVDWQSNFAYARSPVDGRLWAVHWNLSYANEWNIGAVYVPHVQLDWRSGSRLFSSRPAPDTSVCTAAVDIRSGCHDAVGGPEVSARAP